MKICLVIPPYLPVPAVKGGAVETLAEELIKLNETIGNLEIDCVTLEDNEARNQYSKYTKTNFLSFEFKNDKLTNFLCRVVSFVSKHFFKNIVDLKRIIISNEYKKLINSKEYDFIISEGVNYYLLPTAIKNIEKNKLILHLHKVTEPTIEFEEEYGNFISISEFVSNRFNQKDMIKKDRIYTVYNGIDLKKFERELSSYEKKELKNKYGIKDNELVFLYTGRLLPMKGVKELIQAFKKANCKTKSKLMIVGAAVSGSNNDTEYTLELKKIAQNENVIFTGYISNDELYKYYKISDIAVFPTIGEEGFGLVAVEAMHCGLPLIVTNSGGLVEVATDDCALKVENDENIVENLATKIDYLYKNDKLRKSMGQAAYENSKKFSSEQYYKNYIEVLKKIQKKEDNIN